MWILKLLIWRLRGEFFLSLEVGFYFSRGSGQFNSAEKSHKIEIVA